MACVRETPTNGGFFSTQSPTSKFEPLTAWMPAVEIGTVDFLMEIRNVVGLWEGKPGVEFASVKTEEPDAPAAISAGSFESSNGFHHFQEAFSTTDKMFVRFGLVHKNSATGTNLGSAEVKLTVASKSCGELLGANTVVVNPGITTGKTAYFPVTGWYPAVGLSKAMAAFVVMGNAVASSLDYRLAVRQANDKTAPYQWFDLESGWTTAPATGEGNSARNSTEVGFGSPTPAMNAVQWVQFGLAVKPQTTDCRAIVHAAVGVTHT